MAETLLEQNFKDHSNVFQLRGEVWHDMHV
jgi:hypothetical protein